MIESKRTCNKCQEIIPNTRGWFRVSMELILLNGNTNTAVALNGADLCSQACLFATVKEMVSADPPLGQETAKRIGEAT